MTPDVPEMLEVLADGGGHIVPELPYGLVEACGFAEWLPATSLEERALFNQRGVRRIRITERGLRERARRLAA